MKRELPEHFDRLSPEMQARVLAVIETEARQSDEMTRVQTWTWERLAEPGYGTRRQREVITAERHPSGWPANLGHDTPHVCKSIHQYARDRNREAYGPFHDANPVVWRITHGAKRSRTRYVAHYCDAHLPEEYRPVHEMESA